MSASVGAECSSDSRQPGAPDPGDRALIPKLSPTGSPAGADCPGGRAGNPVHFPGARSQAKTKSP